MLKLISIIIIIIIIIYYSRTSYLVSTQVVCANQEQVDLTSSSSTSSTSGGKGAGPMKWENVDDIDHVDVNEKKKRGKKKEEEAEQGWSLHACTASRNYLASNERNQHQKMLSDAVGCCSMLLDVAREGEVEGDGRHLIVTFDSLFLLASIQRISSRNKTSNWVSLIR